MQRLLTYLVVQELRPEVVRVLLIRKIDLLQPPPKREIFMNLR
jgi:hypothetical protein